MSLIQRVHTHQVGDAVRPDVGARLPPAPRDVFEAVRALRQVTQTLRQLGDTRAIFPDIYGIITERVAGEINGRTGFFKEPSFIARLAGRFAERYLETLRWSLQQTPQDCAAWGIAYRYSTDARLVPLQHAALGISAHINYDLAPGIYRTICELGAARNPHLLRRFKHDHDKVNVLLEACVPPSLRTLAGVYQCRTSALVERFSSSLRLTTRVAIGAISRWRERVWDNVVALLDSPGERARQRVIARMDARAGFTGRLLATSSAGGMFSRHRRMLHPLPLS
ncbi:MAG TPA: DUF5995 family protein [Myxococcaceae bacterium]|nr:DUF5995 family protein [Myxococcaceae bacterium]